MTCYENAIFHGLIHKHSMWLHFSNTSVTSYNERTKLTRKRSLMWADFKCLSLSTNLPLPITRLTHKLQFRWVLDHFVPPKPGHSHVRPTLINLLRRLPSHWTMTKVSSLSPKEDNLSGHQCSVPTRPSGQAASAGSGAMVLNARRDLPSRHASKWEIIQQYGGESSWTGP